MTTPPLARAPAVPQPGAESQENPPPESAEAAAALARNERYVREFVEALGLCPYAQRCRETGRLHRAVVLIEGGAPGTPAFAQAVVAVDEAIARVEALPEEAVEVALLILPALSPALSAGLEGAHAFERLVAQVRDHMIARHAGGDTPFYCVAFHPDFAQDLADESRAVRFIRKSPDPTLQLVRAHVLRAVRGVDPGSSRYVDVSAMTTAELMAITAPLSVSDRIALANLRTLHAEGPERLSALLSAIRGSGR